MTVTTDLPVTRVEPGDFRHVLGHFASGITVVTAIDDGEPVGFACQSFTSLSLDPPLVLFCPSKSSTTWPRIQRAGRFCVNVLAEDQQKVSQKFAVSGGDKFREIAWRPSNNGSPIIDDVLAWVDCTLENVHEAGDHYVVIGRVLELSVDREHKPLLFFRGEYA